MRKEKINLPIKFSKNKGIIIDKNANKLLVLYAFLHLYSFNLLNNNNRIIKNTTGNITKKFLREKEYVNINIPKVTNPKFNSNIIE